MSSANESTRVRKGSIFDIDDLDQSESNTESPPKKLRHSTLPNSTENTNKESEQFENDGFEDLDFSLIGSEHTNEKITENQTQIKLDEDVVRLQQKERADKNRQKALALKNAKLILKPDNENASKQCFLTGESLEASSSQPKETKTIDTGAGFFIDEDEDDFLSNVTEDPAPFMPDPKDGRPRCKECNEELLGDSYLFKKFDLEVCDKCKNTGKDEKHELITKTDAKNTFLLKDCDFDRREPPLKYIVRKNPHNPRWGDMRLYLRLQVEQRALEVWETPEALENEIEKKGDKKEIVKAKKLEKRIKALRMQMRGSLFSKDYKAATGVGHEHDYEPEIYHEEKDEYSQKCTICGYVNNYEKM